MAGALPGCPGRSPVRALAAVVILYAALTTACSDRSGEKFAPMPWEIERLDSGRTRVLGIELGADSLADATKVLGSRYELAIFGRRDEVPTLEAYYKEVTLGGLSARIVLSLALPAPELDRLRQNSPEDRILAEGEGRRWTVAGDDLHLARSAQVAGISYVPMVQIDEETARKRFGEPDEVVSAVDGAQHWLYPDRGLDLALDPEGRELLQYVQPAEFERLRGPLGP